MAFQSINRRFLAATGLAGFMLAAAGCQSGDSTSVLNVGDKATQPPSAKITASELTAYCPNVTLREGTAYYNTYQKGASDDPTKLIYQASISDVTRACTRANGMLTINVAVAGKVVPGPAGSAGTITMPIRVVVTRGDEVLYTRLHKYQVNVADTSSATQFIFNDPNVTFPDPPERNIRVFAGYDEGPPKKGAATN